MSKINRFNGDVSAFASQALTNERTIFGEVTQSDELTDQINAEFLRGWGIVGASDSPSLQDFSAAMFTSTQFISYLHQMGVAEWNSAQEYPTDGAACIYNGMLWTRNSSWTLGDEPASSSSWNTNQVQPLTTQNGRFRFGMVEAQGVPLPNNSTYTSDEEFVFGFNSGSGAGFAQGVTITNTGITHTEGKIYTEASLGVDFVGSASDLTLYIVDNNNAKHWLKSDGVNVIIEIIGTVARFSWTSDLYSQLNASNFKQVFGQLEVGVVETLGLESTKIAVTGLSDYSYSPQVIYEKSPTGLINLVATTVSTTDSNGDCLITFPFPFVKFTGPVAISLGDKIAGFITSSANLAVDASSVTLTGFKVNVTNSSNVPFPADGEFRFSYSVKGI